MYTNIVEKKGTPRHSHWLGEKYWYII
jgi:hypothetical protein